MEYCLIGIEPSVQANLQPNIPSPVIADQVPADQGDPEDQVDQEDNQDGPEIEEEVQQPPPKPDVPKPKKAVPAPGFFGALVGMLDDPSELVLVSKTVLLLPRVKLVLRVSLLPRVSLVSGELKAGGLAAC